MNFLSTDKTLIRVFKLENSCKNWNNKFYSYETSDDIADGNEDGLFSIKRTSDNKGMITVAKRIDREAASEHLLTVKCFKKSARPHSFRKQYNRQVKSLIESYSIRYVKF
jgi:hypothetical protein